MTITFTIIVLWLAEIPQITWAVILAGFLADVIHLALKNIIGWKGEWR